MYNMTRKNTVSLPAARYAELQARNRAAQTWRDLPNPPPAESARLESVYEDGKVRVAGKREKPRQAIPTQSVERFQGVFIIDLPWPPSVNTYWRHPSTGKLAGRHLISEKGREYRKAVLAAAKIVPGDNNFCLTGRLTVRLDCYPPDRRRRDLDNLPKSILDALQHAGIIEDDGNIDDLRIVRQETGQAGMVRVSITES